VGIPKSFTGNDMMADPKIDVVYVATVHPRHLPDALAAIEAGKHVLVGLCHVWTPLADQGLFSALR
jgi:predicted dehydrogenase